MKEYKVVAFTSSVVSKEKKIGTFLFGPSQTSHMYLAPQQVVWMDSILFFPSLTHCRTQFVLIAASERYNHRPKLFGYSYVLSKNCSVSVFLRLASL